MGDKSKIGWTEATWNCLYGCSRVSPGCLNCYAERHIHRFSGEGLQHEGLTVIRGGRPGWSGKIQFASHRLEQPLRWQRPRMIFVNSLSDIFHEGVPHSYIHSMYQVMSKAQQHTFQVLTKRENRMLEFYEMMDGMANGPFHVMDGWPLKNVWLGVSVEDQEYANKRISKLKECNAAVRWLSMEPLLGRVSELDLEGIGWVVVGGESGPGARPMNPEWAEEVLDKCRAAGVPFFMKQMGGTKDKRSGIDDLPECLKVREYPNV